MADLHEARDRYEQLDAEMAAACVQAFGRVVDRLALFPRSGTPVEGFADVRRARLLRFPYGVFYRVGHPDEVRVLRVLHERRDRSAASDRREDEPDRPPSDD